MRTLKKFLIRRFSYFLVALGLGSILSLILVILLQVHQTQLLLVDRVNDIVQLKRNECLNSIALEDWTSLQEILEDMRKNLNVERISIDVQNKAIVAQSSTARMNSLLGVMLSFFIHAEPLTFDIANDFGNFQSKLSVSYKHQLFDVSLKPTVYYAIAILVITLLLVAILFFGIMKGMDRNIARPVLHLASAFQNGNHFSTASKSDSRILEIQNLFRSLKEFESLRALRSETEKVQALNRLAVQVAHDIRSPLAALNVLVHHSSEIPEDNRVLIRQACTRIKDIANDLISRYKSKKFESEREVVFLTPLIEIICSEKKIQFQNLPSLQIEVCDDSPEVPKFVEIESQHFKRAISNIINNAAEAMNGNGSITISIQDQVENWCIRISDNGPGFSTPGLIEKDTGKLNCERIVSGLGLKHASESVLRWGGLMQVQTSSSGTSINLILKKHSSPTWSMDQLNIKVPGRVLIIDDDENIHEVFERRFRNLKTEGLRIEHHTRPDQIEFDPEALYLVDQEFKNSEITGLDFIRKSGIASNAVLVTSHYEDQGIVTSALSMGFKILPKSMAVTIPVEVKNSNFSVRVRDC